MPATLLVETDDALAEQLRNTLSAAGYSVILAQDGLEALRLFYDGQIDVALIGLPVLQIDGIELIRLLRTLSHLPILALLPASNSMLTVRALESGADDVVNKATPEDELLARIRASSRRAAQRPETPDEQAVVETGDILIDRINRLVTKAGRPITLTQTEYRLLDALAARIGHVAPHRFLLSTVWGDAFVDDTHYLRMYIGYLRSKLEDDPSRPQYLRNEWGTGYRLAQMPQKRSNDDQEADSSLSHEPDVTDAPAPANGRPSESI